jgi:soluble lytic murein transglycosylase
VKVVPRRLLALLALAGIVVAVVVAVPLIRRAIEHFTLPLRYASIIRQQAEDEHLQPALVAAVIYAETRFDPRTSPTGALGLMQIEPQTAKYLAHLSGGTSFTVADLGTPQINITYGTYYLRYLLNTYHGNLLIALAAYNAGETNVDHWVAQAQAAHRRFTVADIPATFTQTHSYVLEVMSKERAYRSHYAAALGYS